MEPEKNSANNPQKPVVQTYAGDTAEVLRSDQAGMIKKIIEGEEEKEKEKKNMSPESRRNRLFLLASISMILVGAALLAYFWAGRPARVAEIAPEFTPIIFTDRSFFIESAGPKREDIIQSVRNQTEPFGMKPNSVVAAYLTYDGRNVGLRQFLSLLKINFTPDPNPLLVSDSYLLGWVNVKKEEASKEGEGAFLLFKTRSAADIFDSLRAWEKKMFYDLHGFFGVSTGGGNEYLLTKDFEDSIVSNKNARVLLDREGKIVLLYVFADNQSVVITDSPAALREIILRLNAKQTKE